MVLTNMHSDWMLIAVIVFIIYVNPLSSWGLMTAGFLTGRIIVASLSELCVWSTVHPSECKRLCVV